MSNTTVSAMRSFSAQAIQTSASRTSDYEGQLKTIQGSLLIGEDTSSSLITQPQLHFETAKIRAELKSLEDSLGLFIETFTAALDLELRGIISSGSSLNGTSFARLGEIPPKTTEGFLSSAIATDETLADLKQAKLSVRRVLGIAEALEQGFRDRSMALHDKATFETRLMQAPNYA